MQQTFPSERPAAAAAARPAIARRRSCSWTPFKRRNVNYKLYASSWILWLVGIFLFVSSPGFSPHTLAVESLRKDLSELIELLCGKELVSKMFCSRRALQQWSLALFLLCSPVPHDGRPIDALSSRIKRSVTHAQLMHDKGRTLQDYKRRSWLQELLEEVHTAEIRDLALRTTGGAGSSGGLPGLGLGINLSTTGSTLHSKPPGGTKNLPVTFRLDEEEGTNLPQETNKSQPFKDSVLKAPGKKKKKGRSGKRREGDKRKRRARSLAPRLEDEPGSGLHQEWRSLLGLL